MDYGYLQIIFKVVRDREFLFLSKYLSLIVLFFNAFFFFLFYVCMYLFIYFWLHWVLVAARGLSLVVASGGYSLMWCAVFPLRWLLLLQSTGSRCTGSVVVARRP